MICIARGYKSAYLALLATLLLPAAARAQTLPPASAPAQTVPDTKKGGTTTPGAAGAVGESHAQTQTSAPAGSDATPAKSQPSDGVLVDQVVAVVNGDLILESDVDEEQRFEAFQPIRAGVTDNSRQAIVQRLIDRELILEEAKLQPDSGVLDADVQAELQTLRKEIPACRQYHCETDASWAKYVAAQGFTMQELTDHWRERMVVLKFIEQRFRTGIRIAPAEIKTYYEKTLLPEYSRQHVSPPPALDTVSERIQQVLLEQQVSALLDDWLKSLKAQGSVRVMKPGEVTP